MLPDTLTEIRDMKDSRVKKPNYLMESIWALGIIFGMFFVLFVLVFSSEIVKLFG